MAEMQAPHPQQHGQLSVQQQSHAIYNNFHAINNNNAEASDAQGYKMSTAAVEGQPNHQQSNQHPHYYQQHKPHYQPPQHPQQQQARAQSQPQPQYNQYYCPPQQQQHANYDPNGVPAHALPNETYEQHARDCATSRQQQAGSESEVTKRNTISADASSSGCSNSVTSFDSAVGSSTAPGSTDAAKADKAEKKRRREMGVEKEKKTYSRKKEGGLVFYTFVPDSIVTAPGEKKKKSFESGQVYNAHQAQQSQQPQQSEPQALSQALPQQFQQSQVPPPSSPQQQHSQYMLTRPPSPPLPPPPQQSVVQPPPQAEEILPKPQPQQLLQRQPPPVYQKTQEEKEAEELFATTNDRVDESNLFVHDTIRVPVKPSLRYEEIRRMRDRQEREKQVAEGADVSPPSEEPEAMELKVEPALIHGSHFMLPCNLFTSSDNFKEIFSMKTWNEQLTNEEREYLMSFLPDVSDSKKTQVLEDLFSGKNFFFGNPADKLSNELLGGFHHPQVAMQRERNRALQKAHHKLDVLVYHNIMLRNVKERKKIYLDPEANAELLVQAEAEKAALAQAEAEAKAKAERDLMAAEKPAKPRAKPGPKPGSVRNKPGPKPKTKSEYVPAISKITGKPKGKPGPKPKPRPEETEGSSADVLTVASASAAQLPPPVSSEETAHAEIEPIDAYASASATMKERKKPGPKKGSTKTKKAATQPDGATFIDETVVFGTGPASAMPTAGGSVPSIPASSPRMSYSAAPVSPSVHVESHPSSSMFPVVSSNIQPTAINSAISGNHHYHSNNNGSNVPPQRLFSPVALVNNEHNGQSSISSSNNNNNNNKHHHIGYGQDWSHHNHSLKHHNPFPSIQSPHQQLHQQQQQQQQPPLLPSPHHQHQHPQQQYQQHRQYEHHEHVYHSQPQTQPQPHPHQGYEAHIHGGSSSNNNNNNTTASYGTNPAATTANYLGRPSPIDAFPGAFPGFGNRSMMGSSTPTSTAPQPQPQPPSHILPSPQPQSPLTTTAPMLSPTSRALPSPQHQQQYHHHRSMRVADVLNNDDAEYRHHASTATTSAPAAPAPASASATAATINTDQQQQQQSHQQQQQQQPPSQQQQLQQQ